MYKKIINVLFAVSLLFITLCFSNSQVMAKESNNQICVSGQFNIVNKNINSLGHEVITFEDGVELEVINDNNYIVRDYNNTASINRISPGTWKLIGEAILKIVGGTLSTCQTVEYITGHDICRIVLGHITTPKNNGTYKYKLSGKYIAGRIPGCEPSHSLGCNSGYWEYKVVRK